MVNIIQNSYFVDEEDEGVKKENKENKTNKWKEYQDLFEADDTEDDDTYMLCESYTDMEMNSKCLNFITLYLYMREKYLSLTIPSDCTCV